MKTFLPGSTLGLLGGGQLGRMIAVEARRMGYRTVSLDPVEGGPAAQVCDESIVAAFDDPRALAIAGKADVITLEWENVPAALIAALAERKPVLPGASVIEKIQDRLVQREFLLKKGFPQTPFAAVSTKAELERAVEKIGLPALLKTRRHGYDGKGQQPLKTRADVAAAAVQSPSILEAWVPFEKEISVILARRVDGEAAVFPIAENVHRGGILHTSAAPARIGAPLAKKAQRLARAIAGALDHVGVIAVEMFALGNDLLVNEIAPRVHNSGHYTYGACATSQFEQQVRAVCGLPLGETRLLSPVVMVNLLGELWDGGAPRWAAAAAPDVKLHLYGKARPAPGRKMGHALILDEPARALKRADALLRSLKPARS